MTTKCDDCGRELTEEEIARNAAENEEQDGNTNWCDGCARAHAAMDDDAREQWAHETD